MKHLTSRWMMAGAAWLLMAVAAHANSIPAGSYNVNDVVVNGYYLTGTLTLDTSGIVTAADLTLNDAVLGNPAFTHLDSAGGSTGNSPIADFAYISAPGIGRVTLNYLTAPDGSGDIDLCIQSLANCKPNQASYM